jgi:hypothetical protein
MPAPVSSTGQAYSGIQSNNVPLKADLFSLDPRLRGNDDTSLLQPYSRSILYILQINKKPRHKRTRY